MARIGYVRLQFPLCRVTLSERETIAISPREVSDSPKMSPGNTILGLGLQYFLPRRTADDDVGLTAWEDEVRPQCQIQTVTARRA